MDFSKGKAVDLRITRRSILGAGALFLAAPRLVLAAGDKKFRFVVIGDSHIIDDTYECCERGGPEGVNTRTLYTTAEHLEKAVEGINKLDPRPDFVILVGDMVHNFSRPLEYYFENRCHIDIARDILNKLKVPWYALIGNHDMEDKFDPEEVARLFVKKIGVERIGEKAFMSFDHKGFRFILLNLYRGERKNGGSRSGRLGREQFDWLKDRINSELPVLLFSHPPPNEYDLKEFQDDDIGSLIQRSGGVKAIFSGHIHVFIQGPAASGFGVPGYVVGSTRANERARFVVEADPDTEKIKITNSREFIWGLQ